MGTQGVRPSRSPALLMVHLLLRNEVPLPVSYFLYCDLLPLRFNEQELSRKIRRISVHLHPEERGGEDTYVCAHMRSGVLICVHVYVCTGVVVYVHTCVPTCTHVCTCELVSMHACCPFLGLYCALPMSLKALRMLSRYNNNNNNNSWSL